jgi:beta-galactosidase
MWGTCVTTPNVSKEYASVRLAIDIEGAGKGQWVDVNTVITDKNGNEVAQNQTRYIAHGQGIVQNFIVNNPLLWSPETPDLYTAKTVLSIEGKEVDTYTTRFGVRKLEFIPEKGFFLNGVKTKFKGVCNHHDLGPLGAAVNRSALRHQIEMLKDMGVNAIRTSHNMPAPELVELCDEMGIMLMLEPFDDWGFRPKSPNGYGSYFNEWAEKDVTNMVKHYRNSPSVVMWSIGNEVPSQWGPDGVSELTMLQNIVHGLDATRPVTSGMDQIGAVLDNGFAASLDLPGFNYKPQHYENAYAKLPQKLILGSETASTVSSRGVYHFPVIFRGQEMVEHEDHQSNSYDNEACYWSNTPDIDFAMDDDKDWVIGQFVWTGFDYLGEPTPYDTDAWPNHSSVFGIIDLASLPKDRYYLYRSKWNENSPTLHVLPHWNWEGREGEITPVFVYTSYPKAELFINGESQGTREKNDSTYTNRYRLMWNETRYTPGELKVVAYDKDGHVADTKIVRTAGKADHLVVTANRATAPACDDELIYFTVQVADKDGNIVPTDNRLVNFKVEGAGKFEATANGDPTCVMSFQEPKMALFSGAATAIVRASNTPGTMTLKVSAKGIKSGSCRVEIK